MRAASLRFASVLTFLALGATGAVAQEIEISCDSQYASYGAGESILNLCTDGSYSNVAYEYGTGVVYYDGTFGSGFVPVSPEGPPTHVQSVPPAEDTEAVFAVPTPRRAGLERTGGEVREFEAESQEAKPLGASKLAPPIWLGIAAGGLCHVNQQSIVAQLIAACHRIQENRDPTRPSRGPTRINAGFLCGWGASVTCP
jgi:hypothetical protein